MKIQCDKLEKQLESTKTQAQEQVNSEKVNELVETELAKVKRSLSTTEQSWILLKKIYMKQERTIVVHHMQSELKHFDSPATQTRR